MTNPTPIRATMIDTRDLKRTFKTRGGTVEAVAGVDLRVSAGEIFGFLGPNGAGKTTTLRMLATLIRRRPARPPWRASISSASRTSSGSGSATSRRAARRIRPRPAAASSSSRAGSTG